MKERPMLFNGEMVRAILDGRKTQTRRVMKVQPEPSKTREGDFWFSSKKLESMVHISDFNPGNNVLVDCHLFYQEHCCPFGQVGDRLWVRETFRLFDKYQECGCSDFPCNCPSHGAPIYRASHNDCEDKWTPSIHMPRTACRLVLEITGVRVERLGDISEKDALAEGLSSDATVTESGDDYTGLYASDRFSYTWQKIYGQKSWLENPWVWVITFKCVEVRA